jgi:hypothetical protein
MLRMIAVILTVLWLAMPRWTGSDYSGRRLLQEQPVQTVCTWRKLR